MNSAPVRELFLRPAFFQAQLTNPGTQCLLNSLHSHDFRGMLHIASTCYNWSCCSKACYNCLDPWLLPLKASRSFRVGVWSPAPAWTYPREPRYSGRRTCGSVDGHATDECAVRRANGYCLYFGRGLRLNHRVHPHPVGRALSPVGIKAHPQVVEFAASQKKEFPLFLRWRGTPFFKQ